MGQQHTKQYDVQAKHSSGEKANTSDNESETLVETLNEGLVIEEHRFSEQDSELAKEEKKRVKKPTGKVKTFLSENKKEVKLKGTFKSLEQRQISRRVKEQNFFLEDIPEEDGGTTLPAPIKDSSSRANSKKRRPPKRRNFGRKAKMRIVPLVDEDDGSTCVSLSNFNAVMVPNELFDIAVIPPPPEFSTPNFLPQDDHEIQTHAETDKHIYKQLVEVKLTPVERNNFGEAEDEFITPVQLFNCMNDGQKSPYMFDPTFLLLIDTRSHSSYEKCHISTAYHVLDIQSRIEEFKPVDQYTMIVLYDDDGRQYSLKNSDISIAMDLLLNEGADAFVLEGGYSVFAAKFPFWCTDKVPTDTKARAELIHNLPSIVLEDQVYIGQVDQAANEATIDYLGITHIVCITQESSMPFKDRVVYHHVQLSDDPSSQLQHHFADTIHFISEAVKNNGKILVHCNLGQSRSATIVLAYLMYTMQWTLANAFRYLLDCRPVVHPNEGFMRQLSSLECALFGSLHTDIEEFGYSRSKIVSKGATGKTSAELLTSKPSQDGVGKFAKPMTSETSTKTESISVEASQENAVSGGVSSQASEENGSEPIEQYHHNSVESLPIEVTPEKKTVSSGFGFFSDTHEIFDVATEEKNGSAKTATLPTKGVSRCVVKSLDGIEKENFEEEILLSDTKASGYEKSSVNGLISVHENGELSASCETLENTIVAI